MNIIYITLLIVPFLLLTYSSAIAQETETHEKSWIEYQVNGEHFISDGTEEEDKIDFQSDEEGITVGFYDGRPITGTIKFYDRGKLCTLENFVNGKRHGLCVEYHDEKAWLLREAIYDRGKIIAIKSYYTANGALRSEDPLPDRNGYRVCQGYYKSGQLRSESEYIYNQPEGFDRTYYSNGQLEREANYLNGLKEGLEKHYYENGALKSEILYAKGKKHGLAKEYDENGKSIKETSYEQGEEI